MKGRVVAMIADEFSDQIPVIPLILLHPGQGFAGILKTRVSVKRMTSLLSIITGKVRHSLVSPGTGLTRTESSSLRVDRTEDLPSLGWPTIANAGTTEAGGGLRGKVIHDFTNSMSCRPGSPSAVVFCCQVCRCCGCTGVRMFCGVGLPTKARRITGAGPMV